MVRLVALFLVLFTVAAAAQQPLNITQVNGQSISQVIVTPVLANSLSTTVVTVKSTAAKLDLWHCYNPNSSPVYLQVFDIAGSPTLGSTTPKQSFGIPANQDSGLAAMGLTFSNAIKVAATTTATGSTAPTTAINCNFGWW